MTSSFQMIIGSDPPRRRSARLQMRNDAKDVTNNNESTHNKRKRAVSPPLHIRQQRTTPQTNKKSKLHTATAAAASKKQTKDTAAATSLPRTKEKYLLSKKSSLKIIGVDEAGRGPLAGPVVAAAIHIPPTSPSIPGILDSKQVKEESREELYKQITTQKDIEWAVAVVDAPKIDEINILQATMLGMKMAVETLILRDVKWNVVNEASVKEKGSYVVRGGPLLMNEEKKYHVLIDGNRSPSFDDTNQKHQKEGEEEELISSTPIIKGDSLEYSIAAASILAKVTRDALMKDYDALYPQYELERHKGYPTAAHMKLVWELGASPIHRRSFAPLKHMVLDEDGKILGEKKEEEKTTKSAGKGAGRRRKTKK
mmetsp:Transcript_40564/g.61509  ORF Transcript_40564/g.61509 Transcript_40564/m.61509 type:complete len:369 (+) Transcript_40564:326-1432(+)